MMMNSQQYARFTNNGTPVQQHHTVKDSFLVRMKKGVFTTVDPQGNFLQQWNKGVLILCVIALALDPLFFYIPEVDLTKICVELDGNMAWAACVLRTIVDVLYVFHILLKFRTAFIPTSGDKSDDLVRGSKEIAYRYLSSYLYADILAILPLPQIMMLRVFSSDYGPATYETKESLKFLIFAQSIPRIIRIYPIYKQFISTSGFLAQAAWASAAFNLFLYMLASHTAGAFWYLISVEQQVSCWNKTCKNIKGCDNLYVYCDERQTADTARLAFFNTSMVGSCPLINPDDITDLTTIFDFGIFTDALRSRVVQSKSFPKKLLYCSWWGLRNLSSVGQNLKTSMSVGEILFAIGISVFGLVLFALLIGNMQTYLQSLSVREEKMRVRRGDTEKWMSRRRLPDAIKKKVRQYEQSKWQLTRGVDEEMVIKNLPKDLRREIHRHIWNKTFVKPLIKVNIFKEMEQRLIDEMFDLVKPVVFPKKTTIVEEGGLVEEILFITKGCIKTGNHFIKSKLKAGDLFGDELLTWGLTSDDNNKLPISTRNVETLSQVEAYALAAKDFKFIASKFQSSLDSNKVEHAEKYHSVKLRTQGASTIQKAWRKHKKMMLENALHQAQAEQP